MALQQQDFLEELERTAPRRGRPRAVAVELDALIGIQQKPLQQQQLLQNPQLLLVVQNPQQLFEVRPITLVMLRQGMQFLDPWPLAASTLVASQAMAYREQQVFDDYDAIQQCYLETAMTRMTSLSAAADRINLNRTALKQVADVSHCSRSRRNCFCMEAPAVCARSDRKGQPTLVLGGTAIRQNPSEDQHLRFVVSGSWASLRPTRSKQRARGDPAKQLQLHRVGFSRVREGDNDRGGFQNSTNRIFLRGGVQAQGFLLVHLLGDGMPIAGVGQDQREVLAGGAGPQVSGLASRQFIQEASQICLHRCCIGQSLNRAVVRTQLKAHWLESSTSLVQSSCGVRHLREDLWVMPARHKRDDQKFVVS